MATDELIDFDEELLNEVPNEGPSEPKEAAKKGTYAGIHGAGFRDFMLKPELLRAITDAGFEHPSEVQHECIPQAILNTDVICQAKSGMGKTAVFVLSVLQQMDFEGDAVRCLVMCHTRELAFQINSEFKRFSKFLPQCRVAVVLGGIPLQTHVDLLSKEKPQVVVGTPGRVLELVQKGHLKLDGLKHFVLDECDHLLNEVDMRRQVQQVFMATPKNKQVMMFSATLSQEALAVARKFAQNPIEILVEDQSKLTLHGLQQHMVELRENEKNRKLVDLLDALEFNQVVIFVNKGRRAQELNKLLEEINFPSVAIHGRLPQEERLKRFKAVKDFQKRVLVATDLFGRGIDIERINIVINYDMATTADQYLHRVGRAGRFGTKGLAVSFISSDEDRAVLAEIEKRFNSKVTELPDQIDVSTYMTTA